MTEPSGEALRLFYNPAARTILQEVLRKPERWAKYQDVTFEQVAAVAQEAGFDDPEVVALAYMGIKAVTELPADKVRELISAKEGARRDG